MSTTRRTQRAAPRIGAVDTADDTTDDTAGDTTEERRARARVPLQEGGGMLSRLLCWYSRRTYGQVLDNGLALLHNPRVLWSVLRFESSVARWKRLDPDLKVLAQAASAAMIGCSWCMDFGYYAAHADGLDTSRLAEVPRWRRSVAFTERERRVLEYAEAVTATPPQVTDDMTETLRADLGEDAFVELTMLIAVENERSRFNSSLGLTSQGFKDHCVRPEQSAHGG